MSEAMERELGWEDEISQESEFTLLPEGVYDFTVKSFKRGRHDAKNGGTLPPCNKAILEIEVANGTDKTTITHNLFLHTKTEGILSQFFISIGQKKHGEPLRMNWNLVTGAKGKCKVYIDEYTGKDGQKRQSNKIKSFLEPPATMANVSVPEDDGLPIPPPTYTQGSF